MSYDLSRILFSIDNKSFNCGDFLTALKFFGIYDGWNSKIAKSKKLMLQFDLAEKEVDLEKLNEMSSDFRYSEKLLTSEEFNSWLNEKNFEISDFESYLKRTYWVEQFDEDKELPDLPDISESEFFAEIYFSGAYKGLLNSWLKRLIAWRDNKSVDFPDCTELEENYQSYHESLLEYFDLEKWFQLGKGEFKDASIDDPEVAEEFRERFLEEVWKTLRFKYVC